MVDARDGTTLRRVEVPPAPRAVTMLTLIHGWPDDADRWLGSVLAHTTSHDFEALLVDNSGDPQVGERLAAGRGDRVRVLTVAPPAGWAQAANRALAAATGEVVVLFDPGVELHGDVAGPLIAALSDPTVAVAGPFGVRGRGHVGEFEASAGPDVDAVEGYALAFRRAEALAAGGFDPKFRFYRLADLELCLRLRDRTRARALVVPDLPVARHEHRLWASLDPAERERLSRRNYHRLRERWGTRQDLITG